MLIDKDIRVDKWLWAVRVFKTRSSASDACRKGKVLVNNAPVKPSRIIKINDVVSVRRQTILYSYKVKGLLGKRLSARLITEFVENITPETELEKLKHTDTFFIRRDKGTGRPTKKERRTLDKIQRHS
jgi:ribosome-associated heat shock protein Hsp15